jgi:hypothetical protein
VLFWLLGKENMNSRIIESFQQCRRCNLDYKHEPCMNEVLPWLLTPGPASQLDPMFWKNENLSNPKLSFPKNESESGIDRSQFLSILLITETDESVISKNNLELNPTILLKSKNWPTLVPAYVPTTYMNSTSLAITYYSTHLPIYVPAYLLDL